MNGPAGLQIPNQVIDGMECNLFQFVIQIIRSCSSIDVIFHTTELLGQPDPFDSAGITFFLSLTDHFRIIIIGTAIVNRLLRERLFTGLYYIQRVYASVVPCV